MMRDVDDSLLQIGACRQCNINPKQYCNWVRSWGTLASNKPKDRSVSRVMLSMLDCVNQKLERFVFELRKHDMAIKNTMIRMKAVSLIGDFCNKSIGAQQKAVQKYIQKSPFVSRIGILKSQKAPSESEQPAFDFMESVVYQKVMATNHN